MHLLQSHASPLIAGPATAFPLAGWRQATTLGYFGVELRLVRGAVRVVLRQFDGEGREMVPLAVLERAEPGSEFSPPLHLPDLGALLMPEVAAASDDAACELRVFTLDAAPNPPPRVCHLLPAADAAAAATSVQAFRAAAGPDDRLVVLLDDAGGAAALAGAGVAAVAAAAAGAWGQGLHGVLFGAGASAATGAPGGFTHFCLIRGGLGLPAETFARLGPLLRFLRPGVHVGAAVWDAADPARLRALGRRLTAALDHPDPPLLSPFAATADFTPDLLCLAREDALRIGLPWPYAAPLAAEDHAAAVAAALGPPAVLLSLRTEAADGSAADPGGAVPPPDPAWLRARALMLLRRGVAPARLADGLAAVVEARLAAGQEGAAAALVATVETLLAGPAEALAAPLPAAPPAPPASAVLRARLAGVQARVLARAPDLAEATRALEERLTGPAFWTAALAAPDGRARLLAPPSPEVRALATEVDGLHRRLDALESGLRAALAAEAAARRQELHAAGLDDPARARADLDRASRLALAALRGVHAGRRGVIVGNGPSLQVADLDRLKGEVTFGSNRIYLAYDQTTWRPSYYSVEDGLVMQASREAIAAVGGSVKIFPDNMRELGYHAADTIFVPLLAPRSYDRPLDDPDFPAFSDDLVRGVAWGSTVIYSQIQMAVHMGLREIVLIGIDHDYAHPRRKVGNAYVQDQEVNHFHPDYRRPGELWHQPNLEVLEVSYARARAACAARGIAILNASRRSRLTVFERADFDALFPPRGTPAMPPPAGNALRG